MMVFFRYMATLYFYAVISELVFLPYHRRRFHLLLLLSYRIYCIRRSTRPKHNQYGQDRQTCVAKTYVLLLRDMYHSEKRTTATDLTARAKSDWYQSDDAYFIYFTEHNNLNASHSLTTILSAPVRHEHYFIFELRNFMTIRQITLLYPIFDHYINLCSKTETKS